MGLPLWLALGLPLAHPLKTVASAPAPPPATMTPAATAAMRFRFIMVLPSPVGPRLMLARTNIISPG
jgi:hypothetical protein